MPTSPVTLLSPGSAQTLRTTADYIDPNDGTPRAAQRYCNKATVQLVTAGAKVFLGLQAPQGVSGGVSSSRFDIQLDATTPSFTIGPFDDGNGVDLGSTYYDSDTPGAKVSVAAMVG